MTEPGAVALPSPGSTALSGNRSDPAARSARQEWSSAWRLPLIGMAGVSGSTLFAYSSGVFMERMSGELGWSRAAFSAGFALQMIAGLFIMPLVGWLTDRFGARRVAIFGGIPFALAFSLLGTANGSLTQWYLLCLLMSGFQACLSQPVWISAIVGRFEASRGLAMAVTLSGMGLGTLLWPNLTAFYLQHLDWRLVFPALAMSWAFVVLPLVVAYFRPAGTTSAARGPKRSTHDYGAALRSRAFVALMVAGGLFACGYYGLIVHLVPILGSSSLSLTAAASIASLAGLFSIIGRLGTGHLLDRVSPRLISIIVFLLPAVSVAVLMASHGSPAGAVVAVAILGLASGAELDILTYFASRSVRREVFASVYGILTAVISISAGLGPLIAGALFDHSGSYSAFLMLIIPTALVCAGLMALFPLRLEAR